MHSSVKVSQLLFESICADGLFERQFNLASGERFVVHTHCMHYSTLFFIYQVIMKNIFELICLFFFSRIYLLIYRI